jgi:hypothetical protein
MNITGSGTEGTSYLGDGTDVLTWDTKVSTNFTFTSGASSINFSNANSPIIKCSNLNFYKLNFTSTASSILTSPALLIDGCNTRYMKFFGSGRIYGNNSYDTLYFSPGKIYKLENNKTQKLNAPNGILIASGTPGNEIAIKAINTGGTPAKIRKLNSGGSMTSFCFDYISVENNEASSDDNAFRFFTTLNSNAISPSGIWDFTRAVFYTPFIQASTDTDVCSANNSTFALSGSGPYIISYTVNNGPTQQAILSNGTPYFIIPTTNLSTTTCKITDFKGDNCGTLRNGVILDDTQVISLFLSEQISSDNDLSTCYLNNENSYIHLYRTTSPRRLISSVKDDASGNGLGTVAVNVKIDPQVNTLNSILRLQRRFGVSFSNQELSTMRLYFTQNELDALSSASVNLGRPAVTLNNLSASGFDNNVMNFTGNSYSIPILSRGAIPTGITTSTNIYFIEIKVSTTSHIIIHSTGSVALPVQLLSFDSECSVDGFITFNWTTASEQNNDYFTIEESIDGISWSNIKKIVGKGNSSASTLYSYYYPNESDGVRYYRLKQTDFDGQSEILDLISVNCENIDLSQIKLSPNPTSDEFVLELNGLKNQFFEISLSDVMGRVVETRTVHILDNSHKEYFNLSNHLKGVYTVSALDKTKTIVKKVVKY